jgi:tetratricopeptide (TPR) repeat protein
MKENPYSMMVILLILLLTASCSMTRFAADQTTKVLLKAAPTYDRESDLELAEQSSISNLKMLEGLLEVTPHNADLLLLASSSFTRYAFGFVEEQIEDADKRYDFEEKEKYVKRAVDFYERGKTYALRLMEKNRKGFSQIVKGDLERFSSELRQLNSKHLPALFWVAYSWGSIINLKQSEPARLAELTRVELMMDRILELDERFFFGGAHLFYGIFFGGRPEMLGGDAEKAREHFEKAIQITKGKFLMAQYMLAKCYAFQIQNRELFEGTLQEIIEAPDDLFPDQRLANGIAKRRAKRLLARVNDLFFEETSPLISVY